MRILLSTTGRSLRFAPALLAGLFALSSASVLGAQVAQPDIRWQAWIGCWEPADAPGTRTIGSSKTPRTCVTPAAGASAAQIATVVDGRIVDRTVIDASGKQFASTREGCNGWESAHWSSTGERLYVRSEFICQGGLKRTANGLMAMSPTGEWLDVQNVAAGSNKGVRVVRMRATTDTAALPAEISDSLRGRALALNTARMAAAATLTGADLVDAARNTDAAVVEAWLVERGQAFLLDAKTLTSLADAGLPGSVVDVMVALTYPKVFALNPDTRTSDFRAADANARPASGNRSLSVIGYDAMGYPIFGYGAYGNYAGYGAFGGRCGSAFSSYYSGYYSPYSYGCGYGYGAYGYGGYGYNGGYGYGWYPGGGPIVVVVGGTPQVGGTRPRVVNGRGYSQGSTGGSGSSSAAPRSSSGSSTSSASSGGSSGSASAGGSSAPAAAPARTAHPKP